MLTSTVAGGLRLMLALPVTLPALAQIDRPFELVRDLEDDRPARPAYGGWTWALAAGTTMIGGDTLWRVGAPGTAPVPLLREVAPRDAQLVSGGELVVTVARSTVTKVCGSPTAALPACSHHPRSGRSGRGDGVDRQLDRREGLGRRHRGRAEAIL